MLVCLLFVFCYFFFFKQKTAYEMRISDWSSDVCSSDLGNLAYLTLLALFPFFILDTALFALLGKVSESEVLISAILAAMPPSAAATIKPAALEVLDARHGWLLWAGAAIALWTVSSVIETLRDILRRAYGARATQPFWKYRLGSIGLILASVIVLMFSFYAQISLTALHALVSARLPNFGNVISWIAATRALPSLGLFFSLWLLFVTLTPSSGRGSPRSEENKSELKS